jgi:hypothetical protein
MEVIKSLNCSSLVRGFTGFSPLALASASAFAKKPAPGKVRLQHAKHACLSLFTPYIWTTERTAGYDLYYSHLKV